MLPTCRNMSELSTRGHPVRRLGNCPVAGAQGSVLLEGHGTHMGGSSVPSLGSSETSFAVLCLKQNDFRSSVCSGLLLAPQYPNDLCPFSVYPSVTPKPLPCPPQTRSGNPLVELPQPPSSVHPTNLGSWSPRRLFHRSSEKRAPALPRPGPGEALGPCGRWEGSVWTGPTRS